ncbi:MAG TPA: hypothetical protein VNI54_04690 [Thermoanaerobaculia bacterium]|nr:hypothetical protein [Thermoanaerobaculia bacterium]
MKSRGIIISLILLLNVTTVAAQKLALVTRVGRGTVAPKKDAFAALTATYFTGDSKGLREGLVDLLKDPVYLDANEKFIDEIVHKFDFDRNFYSFIFVAKDPTAKDPQLVRVLTYPKSFAAYYRDAGATEIELGNASLPGVQQIYDVFLYTGKASIGITYTYTETENPLNAQMIAAAKLVNFGEIASAISSQDVVAKQLERAAPGARPEVDPADKEVVYFTISSVSIPATRATVTAKSTVDFGDTPQKKIRTASIDALADVELRHRVISPCALAIAEASNKAVRDNTAESDDPLIKRDDLKAAVRKAINEVQGNTTCQDEPQKPPVEAVALRADTIRATIDRFLAIADGGESKRMENNTVYTNSPLNRFSLGLVAGGIFNPSGDDRVKLSDEGKVVADPLSGAISVAALYIHPMPYLSGTARPSQAERVRFMVGYVATPEPGLAVGVAYQLFRGLTMNVGYAGMLVDRLAKDVEVGTTPAVERPFERGVARALFAGFGYSF